MHERSMTLSGTVKCDLSQRDLDLHLDTLREDPLKSEPESMQLQLQSQFQDLGS
jgi:hypothetical protein